MKPAIDCNAIAKWLIGRILPTAICVLLSASTFAAQIGQSVQVKNAWIRWLPANAPSGGYMTLTNTGASPLTLIGADSVAFGQVSFHQTHMKNGVSEMTAASALTVAPQSSLRFEPGGYHLMLMQPKQALHPGDHVRITLRFAGGQSFEALFDVRAAGANPPARSDDMGSMPGMQH